MVVERRPRAEIGRDIITDRDQAVGLAARSAMQPGRPLRIADLMKPELVQRNETVMLVYEVPGIMLTVRGKAAEGGAEGDVISRAQRTIQAHGARRGGRSRPRRDQHRLRRGSPPTCRRAPVTRSVKRKRWSALRL